MKLNELKPAPGATQKRKRLGRGPGSGTGKTSGRGHKGYGSRSGSKRRMWFEGGQMPIQRRVPKVGFVNIFRQEFQIVNVWQLERLPEGEEINSDLLFQHGLIGKRNLPVKLLGKGELNRAVNITVDKCSAKARELVEAAGGKIEVTLKPRRR
jgi:large subunit ribosomal protein L15